MVNEAFEIASSAIDNKAVRNAYGWFSQWNIHFGNKSVCWIYVVSGNVTARFHLKVAHCTP